MFLLLSKVVPVFLYPPGLTLFLLAVAFLLRRRSRLAWLLVVTAGVTLWAFSTPLISDALVGAIEARYPPQSIASAPVVDAIIVLGGYLHTAGPVRPYTEMSESADRLWVAAELYKAGKAPLVLLTGGNVPMYTPLSKPEAIAAKELIEQWGVPESAIATEDQSRNTHENAADSAPLLAAHHAKRLLLVTSAFHMPRAYAIFRREGLDVTPFPTDYQTGWEQRDLLFQLMPDAESLFGSQKAIREEIGLVVYRLRGWA